MAAEESPITRLHRRQQMSRIEQSGQQSHLRSRVKSCNQLLFLAPLSALILASFPVAEQSVSQGGSAPPQHLGLGRFHENLPILEDVSLLHPFLLHPKAHDAYVAQQQQLLHERG
eukprot:CAMPEP_0181314702 /NCGR_PEP_ID=MMETSP1101-20121128/14963_1 /TAXON_ID=46948 /ORGANISM="Rhodomonas abbreviata, Strain Caron Lab Isolate" /LENGTH=114 /DNA_ID=CAMNT_0023421821 /DNA_START=242 /DNA_END=583 /DNA_ORIENTATION=-